VTLLLLNTLDTNATVDLDLPGEREIYLLTSSPNLPTSRDVLLNGVVLRVDPSTGALPALNPHIVTQESIITLPPVSYAFVVLPSAQAPACK